MHFAIPQVIFEAIPKDETDQARRYRGYIALDDVNFKPGSHCRGHCTFDAGLCGFKNSDRADFDWSVVSGVVILLTNLVQCQNRPDYRSANGCFLSTCKASSYLLTISQCKLGPYLWDFNFCIFW